MLELAAGCGCLWPDVELSSEPEQEHLLCCDCCVSSLQLLGSCRPLLPRSASPLTWPSRDSAGKISLRSYEMVPSYIKRKNLSSAK